MANISEIATRTAHEIEASLLGGLILDSALLDEVRLVEGDFALDKHRHIWRAINDLVHRQNSVDLPRVKQWLDDRGLLDVVGLPYLVEVCDVGMPQTALVLAEDVANASRRRQLLDVVDAIRDDAMHSTAPIVDILHESEARIFRLSPEDDSKVYDMATLVKSSVQRARVRAEQGHDVERFPTGITSLDDRLFDMRPSSLVVIGGDTGIGKTAFGCTLGANLARAGLPVLYFTIEMGMDEIGDRFVLSRTGFPRGLYSHARNLIEEDWNVLQATTTELAGLPLYVADTPGLPLGTLYAMSRHAVRRRQVRVVIVDYLQLVGYPYPSDEVGSLREITRSLKELARSLNILVIAISQLRKRGSLDRSEREPDRNDLHGSGSIAKDANCVLLLYRPEAYHYDDEQWRQEHADMVGKAQIIIDKQRNGPPGRVTLNFDAQRTVFHEDGTTMSSRNATG